LVGRKKKKILSDLLRMGGAKGGLLILLLDPDEMRGCPIRGKGGMRISHRFLRKVGPSLTRDEG